MHVVYEACGFGYAIAWWLEEQRARVLVVPPSTVERAPGAPVKTDGLDAGRLGTCHRARPGKDGPGTSWPQSCLQRCNPGPYARYSGLRRRDRWLAESSLHRHRRSGRHRSHPVHSHWPEESHCLGTPGCRSTPCLPVPRRPPNRRKRETRPVSGLPRRNPVAPADSGHSRGHAKCFPGRWSPPRRAQRQMRPEHSEDRQIRRQRIADPLDSRRCSALPAGARSSADFDSLARSRWTRRRRPRGRIAAPAEWSA